MSLRNRCFTDSDYQANDYWKLLRRKDYDITGKEVKQLLGSYPYPRTAKKEALLEALFRKNIGLPSYYNCTNDDLRKFIKNRKIDASAVIRGKFIGTHSELLKLLEHADAHLTFPKFMDLPAELRNRVYEFHFSDMRTAYAPIQPPISLASRILRQESLGLFYASCKFLLAVQLAGRSTWTHGWTSTMLRGQCRYRFSPQTLLWLRSTPVKHISSIARLEIRMLGNQFSAFEIDLEQNEVRWLASGAPTLRRDQLVFDHFKQVTDKILKKEQGPKLAEEDLRMFVMAWEKAANS